MILGLSVAAYVDFACSPDVIKVFGAVLAEGSRSPRKCESFLVIFSDAEPSPLGLAAIQSFVLNFLADVCHKFSNRPGRPFIVMLD